MKHTVVIGVGNDFAHDDAAGLEAVRLLRAAGVPPGVEVLEVASDPAALLEAWEGADVVYVVDAIRTADAPGTVHHLDMLDLVARPGGLAGGKGSSHALGIGEAVSLAKALDRLPPELAVIAVVGGTFDQGLGLSQAVRDAVDHVAGELVRALGGEGIS